MSKILLCLQPFEYIWGRVKGLEDVDTRSVKIPFKKGIRVFNNYNVFYYVKRLHRGYRKYYDRCQELSAENKRLKAELEKKALHDGLEKLFDKEKRGKTVFKGWINSGGVIGRGNKARAQVLADAISGKTLSELKKTRYNRSKKGSPKRYGERSIYNALNLSFEERVNLYNEHPEEFNSRGISLEMLQTWDYKGWRKNNKS